MTGASPSPAALRKFGLSVGGMFLLLGALSRWRGHTVAPALLAAAGVLLVVPALVAPAVLGPVERRWMRFAEVLGRINTRILLTVLYYAVITPVGALRRRAADPLDRRMHDAKPSNWVRRERGPVDAARYRHQF